MAKKFTQHLLRCGKCKEGEIAVSVKLEQEFTTVDIKKCSNKKCRHQYYIKQLTTNPLEKLENKRSITHNSTTPPEYVVKNFSDLGRSGLTFDYSKMELDIVYFIDMEEYSKMPVDLYNLHKSKIEEQATKLNAIIKTWNDFDNYGLRYQLLSKF